VDIGAITKYLTDPATWEVEVNGKLMQLNSTELSSPRAFKIAVLERATVVVPLLKQATWDEILTEKMKDVEEVAAPPDAGEAGQLRFYVEQFCATYRARAKEELKDGRAWWDEANGLVYFRMPALLEYLLKHRQFVDSRRVANALRRWDAGHGQFNVRGVCVQWWSLPAFPTQTEPDDTPRPGQSKERF